MHLVPIYSFLNFLGISLFSVLLLQRERYSLVFCLFELQRNNLWNHLIRVLLNKLIIIWTMRTAKFDKFLAVSYAFRELLSPTCRCLSPLSEYSIISCETHFMVEAIKLGCL